VRTDAGTIFVRLWICAPLLYIFVLMVIDPASFVKFSATLAGALRTFEQRLHGVEWQFREPDSFHVSPKAQFALRCTGLALAVCVALFLAGIVD
jgi:hypothetical protein